MRSFEEEQALITRLSWLRAAAPATLMGVAALAHAEALAPPEVPEVIKALAGENVVLRAHATGVQIYVCGRGADGKSQWTLKVPEAELRDDQGALIGHHAAGPSWRHNDGSEVTGKAVARSESRNSPASLGTTATSAPASVSEAATLNRHSLCARAVATIMR